MKIDYTIKYSKRKTLSIIVERDRTVVVRAPHNVSEERIRREVEKRKELLLEKINHSQKYQVPQEEKEFVSGEMLLYLGNSYKLELVQENSEDVAFDNMFYIGKDKQHQAKNLLKRWYIEKAKEKIIPRARQFAEKLGVEYNNVSILDLKYRWGSCTPKNNIHFNWRIIKAPIYVIDYIIVHELVHLLVANHTEDFWNKVSVQLPAFEKAKKLVEEKRALFGG